MHVSVIFVDDGPGNPKGKIGGIRKRRGEVLTA